MARSFNGTTDQIATPSFTVPAGGTLACWLNPGVLVNSQNGILGQSIHTGFFIIILRSTGKFSYFLNATGVVSVDPGLATASGWTHVAMSYSASAGMATYVNGVSDGTAAANGDILSFSGLLAIGYDPGTSGRNFPGSIADAAEWNTVLTAGEIAALAKGARPYTVRPLSLMAYLPLDGLQSPEPDLSGNQRNGTLTGTALSSGPPTMQFTPRWPPFIPGATVAGTIKFRKTLSQVGGRVGSRQQIGWGM